MMKILRTLSAVVFAAMVIGQFAMAEVWATEKGTYYHLQQNCSGMAGAKEMTLHDADANGKLMCPVCCAADVEVWYTQNGVYFHFDPDCSGMKGAGAGSWSDAVSTGKKLCPVCWAASVWCTNQGVYCHSIQDCSGMRNAHETTLLEAVASGKDICPNCLAQGKNGQISGSNVQSDSGDAGVVGQSDWMGENEQMSGNVATDSMNSLPEREENNDQ